MADTQIAESSLEKAFAALLRGTAEELDAHLNTVAPAANLAGTKANLHCHHLHLDGNGRPKVSALVSALVSRASEYAIPKLEWDRAKAKDAANNNSVATIELHRRAVRLFVESDTSGEGGELLLYCLIQSKLRVPQLLCKMSLKTNTNMHVHGADGIHAKIDPESGKLAFYWAESKLHAEIGNAISECLDSILPFLHDDPKDGKPPRRQRDLELVRQDLSKLSDEVLETALLNFLDPDHADYNKVHFRGACLIGFDCKKYPDQPNALTAEALAAAVKAELEAQWKKKVADKITDRSPLETFDLEVFLVPMPDVETFRKEFRAALKA